MNSEVPSHTNAYGCGNASRRLRQITRLFACRTKDSSSPGFHGRSLDLLNLSSTWSLQYQQSCAPCLDGDYTAYAMSATLMTSMEENRTHVRLTNELLMSSVPELNTSNH